MATRNTPGGGRPAAGYTARYIEAVTRSLPVDQREDYGNELSSSIRDQIEDRMEAGEKEEDAERAVLTELGDPGRLAAGYAGRPLRLIGPTYYLTWLRVLKIVLWSVLPVVAVAVAIGFGIAEPFSFGIIGPIVGITLSVGVHLVFWVTLVFALVDRAGESSPAAWTPDSLPLPVERRAGRVELIVGFVYTALLVAAVVWDGLIGFIPWSENDGEPLPILHPVLWPWSPNVVAVLFGATVLFELVVYLTGRRSWWFAVGTAITTFIGAVLVIGLLVTDRLFNPVFIELTRIPADAQRVIAVILIVVTIGLSIWGIVEAIRRVLAARR